jgi:hypothetical protein
VRRWLGSNLSIDFTRRQRDAAAWQTEIARRLSALRAA